MALDPYASCPCGSGKKFKWCCQPIHVQIDQAFRQDAEGQHDAALRLMDQVTQEHPSNPEAWGRKAQLLYQSGKVEESESALQKAFEINPNYPFGYLLRGMFRYHEAEFAGATLLFRKAADLYDPDARDVLAQVYSLLADCELKLNKPIAGHAALKIALHLQPSNEELRQGLVNTFGEQSRLPAVVRRDYTFEKPAAEPTGQRRASWDRALETANSPRLSDTARAFHQLTQEDPSDAAAWYNLGLAHAWLGGNRAALEALDQYVRLEPDEARAGAAWALGEVLRCGQGMEDVADYLEHSCTFQIREPQPFINLLQQWEQEHRLLVMQAGQEENVLAALILEKSSSVITVGQPGKQVAKLAANLMVLGGLVRVWHTNKESVAKVRQEIEQHAAAALSPGQERSNRAGFGDILAEALAFPAGQMPREEAEQKIRGYAEQFFEEVWIHRPLKSLSQIPPIDAAGDRTLRKKLIGDIQFLQDCAGNLIGTYDFDRLRRKLGLLTGEPAPAAAGPVEADIGAMGAAELATLAPEQLNPGELDLAYRTAVRLDAHELAGRFARALVARPVEAGQEDRFPYYSYLVQRALQEGATDQALSLLQEAEQADAGQNEGRRVNEYQLRRAQVLAKRGDAEAAQQVFEQLIERVPSELKYRGSAAEAMLGIRQGPRALRFAEQGLAKARERNDRDSEQYFLELVSAARKQGG